MSITLDEVNFLIIKYLKENNFSHTAYIFELESFIKSSNLNNISLPPQTLVNILQKSIEYLKIQKKIKKIGKNPNDPLFKEIVKLEEKYFIKEEEIEEKLPIFEKKVNFINQTDSQTQTIQEFSTTNSIILTDHVTGVFSSSWSPNGNILVTTGEDSKIIVWDFSNGFPKKLFEPNITKIDPKIDQTISTIDWSSDGHFFAVGSFDSSITVFSSSGYVYYKYFEHQGKVFSLKFNPSNTFIVSGSSDNTIILWDIQNKNIYHKFTSHKSSILDLSWKNSEIFASASADSMVSICSIDKTQKILESHSNQVLNVLYNIDGSLLASSSEDCTIIIWKDDIKFNTLKGHISSVIGIKWLNNSKDQLISTSSDFSIILWDVLKNEKNFIINQNLTNFIYLFDISFLNNYIIIGDSTGIVHIFNFDGSIFSIYKGFSEVLDIKFKPNSNSFIVCFQDGKVIYKNIN